MIELLQPLGQFFWSWIVPLSIQGAFVLLLVAIVDRLLPARTWPQLTATLWALALLKMALPPIPGLLDLLPGVSTPAIAALGDWTGVAAIPALVSGDWALPAGQAAVAPVVRWGTLAAAVWLAVLIALAAGGGLRYRRLARRWRQRGRLVTGAPVTGTPATGSPATGSPLTGTPATGSPLTGTPATGDTAPPWLPELFDRLCERLALRRRPELRVVPGLASPFVLGMGLRWGFSSGRPTVFLPDDLTRRQAEHALVHELAHLRRGDPWRSAALTALQLVYWFHPLVWVARRRLAVLTEECCDRTVARLLGDGTRAYRRSLLEIATRRLAGGDAAPLPAPIPEIGLGLLRRRSPLLARLAQLERAAGDRPRLRRLCTAAAAALVLACGLPVGQQAESTAVTVAEMIERPPGCLQLRYLVYQRMAEERAAGGDESAETANRELQ